MDFTVTKYQELLTALECHKHHRIKHDVDLRPAFSLRIAEVEASQGVKSTYYFRSMQFTRYADCIRAIADMGHGIGYHYECLATCHGNIEEAYELFKSELAHLRLLVPVTTACAHGSPLSPYDNQTIWNQYDIHALGIDEEPMLDTDFTRTLYLTDTGRRWDGSGVSIRDKVAGQQQRWADEGLVFHSTDDIIWALQTPGHAIHRYDLLINTHPQRWMPFGAGWMVEATAQWWKNHAKRLLVLRSNGVRDAI